MLSIALAFFIIYTSVIHFTTGGIIMEMYINGCVPEEFKERQGVLSLTLDDCNVLFVLSPTEKSDILALLNDIRSSILYDMELSETNIKKILSHTYSLYLSMASSRSHFITVNLPLSYMVYLRMIAKQMVKNDSPYSQNAQSLILLIKREVNGLFTNMMT